VKQEDGVEVKNLWMEARLAEERRLGRMAERIEYTCSNYKL